MIGAAALLCLCVSLSAPVAQQRDAWFGEDKVMHFVASFFATSISASGARAVGLSPRASAVAGAGRGSAAGVWKEVRDHARPGHSASVRDLVWDAAGVAAGYGVMIHAR
jgi:putative lipoprotein